MKLSFRRDNNCTIIIRCCVVFNIRKSSVHWPISNEPKISIRSKRRFDLFSLLKLFKNYKKIGIGSRRSCRRTTKPSVPVKIMLRLCYSDVIRRMCVLCSCFLGETDCRTRPVRAHGPRLSVSGIHINLPPKVIHVHTVRPCGMRSRARILSSTDTRVRNIVVCYTASVVWRATTKTEKQLAPCALVRRHKRQRREKIPVVCAKISRT